MTDDELLHDKTKRGENWLATTRDKCQWCGHDWHKHEEWCPNWDSVAPKRCRIAHTPFLRSIDKDRGPQEQYEYECQLCNLRPVFSVELSGATSHPLCHGSKPEHYWATCGDGCCPPRCTGCGITGTRDDLWAQMRREQ